MDYEEFLKAKEIRDVPTGHDPGDINPMLFDFQRDIVKWAIKRGRAAIFADCGLGKTPMQLEWASHVCRHTGGNVLILAPLAVSKQTAREGRKFGVDVNICRDQSDVKPGINISNYEMLHHFDPAHFAGVILDESGILKAYTGKYRTHIIEAFSRTPYRLACTATPAPNDHAELGNHSEFLGVMSRTEMLSMFFINDAGDTGTWRLKGHGESEFWAWMCSWAVMIRKPSDLGYEDGKFQLPELKIQSTILKCDKPLSGMLFHVAAKTLSDRRKARRESMEGRCKAAAAMANNNDEQWLIWCDLNDESAMLTGMIPGAVEVKGADSAEFKENAVEWFHSRKCICNAPEFRAKLSTWKIKKNTSGSTISKTEKRKSGSLPNGSGKTATNGESTCGNMPEITRIDSDATPKSKRNTTSGEKLNMLKTQSCDTEPGALLLNGKKTTPSSDSLNGSNLTGLPPTTTGKCSPAKAADAPYANPPTQGTEDPTASISTTATPPDRSGACCALTATEGSGNSKTTPKHSKGQPCICGGLDKTIRKVLVSKPRMFGYGLNLQSCHNMAFVGLSDSYEAYYQAVRRCWRFGQNHPVNAHIITSELEGNVVNNIQRKEADAVRMAEGMVENMAPISSATIHSSVRTDCEYKTGSVKGEGWELINGDCVEVVAAMPDESIDYSIFSPPFASLFTYSNSTRDMGNCAGVDEFEKHFKFLVGELFRVIKTGRLLSFHCMNLPSTITHDGVIGMKDFRGLLIRMFEDVGFIYHSEVCIWKDPLIQATRTKTLTLAHKQISKDSAMCAMGYPDYIVTMRKPGKNQEPIAHGRGFESYAGDMPEPTERKQDDPRINKYSHKVWQRYASPVWFDIRQTYTLNSIKDEKDEKHVCPLQIDTIERCLELWSNPGDTVLSPFAGIGSEGYQSVLQGRKFIGVELKPAYFEQAEKNIRKAEKAKHTPTLFDLSPKKEAVNE